MSSLRAAILVTGTEVLSGSVADRNGPWLSERLRERGVELAHIIVVADRPDDLRAALDFLARERIDLVITSGGLGPTADDLTAEVVGQFAGRALLLDAELEQRILTILKRNRGGWRAYSEEALRAGNHTQPTSSAGTSKQALVPEGATILEPVGTAPGLIVQSAGPLVLVLPGPPSELQSMWATATATEPLRGLLASAAALEQRMLRLYGVPESEIALSLAAIERDGVALDQLEITTCLRRGEIELATVFAPAASAGYEALVEGIRARHGDALFSEHGATVDEQVAGLLAGRTIACAESCTGGLMAARLTDRAGSSAYVLGGVVVYSDAAKTGLADVPAELIERHGAVSPEVAAALADGTLARFGADLGIGITGVAGPGGGTESKPVGMVCLSVAHAGGERIDRTVRLPGDRAMVRERTTTMSMHLLRRLLLALER